jgi:hypothetical protein
MKPIRGIIGATAFAVAMNLSSADAVTILYDYFNGTAGSQPDISNWDPAAPSTYLGGTTVSGTLDGVGNLFLNAASSPQAVVAYTSYATAPTPTEPRLQLTVDLTSSGPWGASSTLFGLHDFAGSPNTIHLRNDHASGNWALLNIKAGAFTWYDTGLSASAASGNTGVWVIDWTANNVTVSLNGTQVLDTLSTAPLSGTGGIPTVPLRPFAFSYSGANARVDSIFFETPEPSAALLAVIGGLLCCHRRRNKR